MSQLSPRSSRTARAALQTASRWMCECLPKEPPLLTPCPMAGKSLSQVSSRKLEPSTVVTGGDASPAYLDSRLDGGGNSPCWKWGCALAKRRPLIGLAFSTNPRAPLAALGTSERSLPRKSPGNGSGDSLTRPKIHRVQTRRGPLRIDRVSAISQPWERLP